jgi:hypothetical protein
MCIHIYVYARIYMHIIIRAYINIHQCTDIYIWIYIDIDICMYIYICIYIYKYMHIYIFIFSLGSKGKEESMEEYTAIVNSLLPLSETQPVTGDANKMKDGINITTYCISTDNEFNNMDTLCLYSRNIPNK